MILEWAFSLFHLSFMFMFAMELWVFFNAAKINIFPQPNNFKFVKDLGKKIPTTTQRSINGIARFKMEFFEVSVDFGNHT